MRLFKIKFAKTSDRVAYVVAPNITEAIAKFDNKQSKLLPFEPYLYSITQIAEAGDDDRKLIV